MAQFIFCYIKKHINKLFAKVNAIYFEVTAGGTRSKPVPYGTAVNPVPYGTAVNPVPYGNNDFQGHKIEFVTGPNMFCALVYIDSENS